MVETAAAWGDKHLKGDEEELELAGGQPSKGPGGYSDLECSGSQERARRQVGQLEYWEDAERFTYQDNSPLTFKGRFSVWRLDYFL